MIKISMQVNGRNVTREVKQTRLLLEFLREDLRLTGTHSGCDTSQCGACTVLLNGESVKSCSILVASCEGVDVDTIEGISRDGALHPMQKAFADHHGLQCGFCTPGMIMAALALTQKGLPQEDLKLRELLHGNLCRCTGYENIIKAVRSGAAAMQETK